MLEVTTAASKEIKAVLAEKGLDSPVRVLLLEGG